MRKEVEKAYQDARVIITFGHGFEFRKNPLRKGKIFLTSLLIMPAKGLLYGTANLLKSHVDYLPTATASLHKLKTKIFACPIAECSKNATKTVPCQNVKSALKRFSKQKKCVYINSSNTKVAPRVINKTAGCGALGGLTKKDFVG
ncbi:MAG: hypothetical protein JW780_03860 [Clostridiales bacterium]|nr:hypothetical protein [Clostridiales bacterium]